MTFPINPAKIPGARSDTTDSPYGKGPRGQTVDMIIWILLVFIALVVIATLVLFRAEDLSRFDQGNYPVYPSHPGDGQQQVLALLREVIGTAHQFRGKARLQSLRQQMDRLSDGLSLTSAIHPSDSPRGEWVVAPGADTRRRVLYIHGGAWIAGSPKSHRAITDCFSQIANAAVFAVDYRLMPEHRFMDGVRDCRNAYTWLLEHGPDGPEPADFVVVAGDSAGGSHTLSLLAWARDNGIRQADAAVALSPSTDLTLTAPSNRQNIATDPLLGPVFGGLARFPLPVLWWGIWAMFRVRPNHPLLSPLRGDLSGLPPTLIHASTSEMLLDNARRYAARAKAAGSVVELHTWTDMVHVWHIFVNQLPEAEQAFADIREFLKRTEAEGKSGDRQG